MWTVRSAPLLGDEHARQAHRLQLVERSVRPVAGAGAAGDETARAERQGVPRTRAYAVIAARLLGASAYMSWDTESLMGLDPAVSEHLDDPLLTDYAKAVSSGSAAGAVTAYSCACAEDLVLHRRRRHLVTANPP